MTGEARNLDGPSAFAAALDSAVVRLKDLLYRLHGAAQARFSLARPAPPGGIVGTPVIPTVRYRDVPAAVGWLCRAFGMAVHRVVNDANGAPCYAELTVGSGMLMVAPIEDTAFGKLMVQPDEIGGVETQVCYLCVGNARAHYARAKAAGAVIVLDPDDEANKGRGYSCRDLEGHVWNFGTYDPWQTQPRPAQPVEGWGRRRVQQGLAALVLLAAAGVLLPNLAPQPSARAGTATIGEPAPSAAPATIAQRPEIAATAAREEADRTIEAHRLALADAERAAAEARTQLAEIRSALQKAERDSVAARAQFDDLQRAKQAAERTATEAREHLFAAQRSAEHAREEATQERARRIAADRAATMARRRASLNAMRPRPRPSRSWCYHPNLQNPVSNGAGRLVGFCKA